MKYWHCVISLSLCLLCGISFALVDTRVNSGWERNLTSLIQSNLPEASVGVVVQDLHSGEIIYNHQGAKHFLPASTSKLLTAAAALKALGPNYRYATNLYYDASTAAIALQFTGDPSLQSSDVQGLLQNLAGKSTINDIWIDDTAYQGPLLGHGWTWDSTSWYHAAPVSAIIIDRNQFSLKLLPTHKSGEKVVAKLEANFVGAKLPSLQSNLHAATLQESETICQVSPEVDEQNNVQLNGCWPISAQTTHLRLAIKNPRRYAQELILQHLAKMHIQVKGQVYFGKPPTSLHQIAQHNSLPLHEFLSVILNESNNLYAETITKTLGLKLFGIGSFRAGSQAIQKTIAEMSGIDFSKARLFDGSGESRYNLLTPLQISRLLYSMQRQSGLAEYFRAALSKPGSSGTLQNRLVNLEDKSSIQAKTGTLAGVSALSGYLRTNSKRDLIVTIMINQAAADANELKNFEDQLCYALMNL